MDTDSSRLVNDAVAYIRNMATQLAKGRIRWGGRPLVTERHMACGGEPHEAAHAHSPPPSHLVEMWLPTSRMQAARDTAVAAPNQSGVTARRAQKVAAASGQVASTSPRSS